MAFIETIPPEQAEGELAAFYERVGEKRGNVANVLQVTSLNPKLSHAHLDLYMSLMYARGGLSRRQRELIATVVSWANDCAYCIVHHSEALARYEEDEALVEALATDPEAADLAPGDAGLVAYALKLTRTPSSVRQEDLEALRALGFDDEDLLAAGAITSYFNFVNRLNLGLGAELEAETERAYDY
ncbi:MAG: peroxidase-related enzyme [Candidatus Thermoplasmatota archaeon]|nr:peroxidase-related enzyme [Candidatus Thermoplasmatota archaeon]